MITKPWKHTILINIGAYLLVAILEILSGWIGRGQFDTSFSFYIWELQSAAIIMTLIWVNHFIFIPFFLDKRHYLLYGILLIGSIFLWSYFKGYWKGWPIVSKFFFFYLYTTGTGMAAFFLRRNMIITLSCSFQN